MISFSSEFFDTLFTNPTSFEKKLTAVLNEKLNWLNAIANKTLLQSKRATWADPFFENIKTQIKTTTETYLGKDAAQELRKATQTVLGIQAQSIIDLAEFKVQIEQDFNIGCTAQKSQQGIGKNSETR